MHRDGIRQDKTNPHRTGRHKKRSLVKLVAGLVLATMAGMMPTTVLPATATPLATHPMQTARAATTAPRWAWPVTPALIVKAYAAPPSRYTAGHRGIDLAALPGMPVTAPADATVHFSGVVVDRPVLTLDHGGGVLSSYEPLIAAGLVTGDSVAHGAVLGVVGEGAHCTGACVHVGVRIDGEYVSPLLFFATVARSVLLPIHASP